VSCFVLGVLLPLLLLSVCHPQHNERQVTWQEGADFAKQHGCLFVETSAKHNIAVGVAFEELVLRILDTPDLLAAVAAEDTRGSSVNLAAAQAPASGMAVSCSC
jgi:Ras-related protein Rab-18